MDQFEMWGPAQSPVASQQKYEMNALAMGETRARTQEHLGRAEEQRSLAAKAQNEQKQKQKLQDDMMSIVVDGKITGGAEFATALAAAGHPVEAMNYLHVAEQTANQKAQADEHRARTEEAQAKTRDGMFNLLEKNARMIGALPPEQQQGAYDDVIGKLDKAGVKIPDQVKNAKVTPELMKKLEQIGASSTQIATQKRLEETEKRREAAEKVQEDLRKAQQELAKEKAETEKIRQQNLRKAGEQTKPVKAEKPAKPIARAPKEDVDMLTKMIVQQFPEVKNQIDAKGNFKDASLAVAASAMASEAQALVQFKGLTHSQALANVFNKHVADGDTFYTLQERKTFLGYPLPDKIGPFSMVDKVGTRASSPSTWKGADSELPGVPAKGEPENARQRVENDITSLKKELKMPNQTADQLEIKGRELKKAEARLAELTPTDKDRAWVKAHPETKEAFKKHFGMEP